MCIRNVMTQHGETNGYEASDHLKALLAHANPNIITHCIVNTGKVPADLQNKYKEENARPVNPDIGKIEKMGYKTIRGNVISAEDYVRHDATKLAKIISELAPAKKKYDGIGNGDRKEGHN